MTDLLTYFAYGIGPTSIVILFWVVGLRISSYTNSAGDKRLTFWVAYTLLIFSFVSFCIAIGYGITLLF